MLEILDKFNNFNKFEKKDYELKKAVSRLIKEDRKLKNAILLDCAIGATVVGTIIGLKMYKCHKCRQKAKCDDIDK